MVSTNLTNIPEVPSRSTNRVCKSKTIRIGVIIGICTALAAAIGISLAIVLTTSTSTTSSQTTSMGTTITSTPATMMTSTSATTTTVTTASTTTSTTSTTTSTTTTSTTTTTTSTTTSTTTTTTTTTTTSTTTSVTTTTTTTSTTTSTTTTITGALTAYGPQLNFNLSTLTAAWSLCYTGLYIVPLYPNISSVLSTCYKDKLLLGCRPVGNTLLTLAAMGNRVDVLYNCSASNSMTHVANGVGWYYAINTPSWNSLGFVSGSDSVVRGNCDGDLSTNPAYRLCWHIVGPYGGYRCGSAYTLDNSTSWERVIYHAM